MTTFQLKLTASLLTTLALGACGGGGGNINPAVNVGPPLVVYANGVSSFDSLALAAAFAHLPIEALNGAEKDSLIFMREEEKLAYDVCAQLDILWGANNKVFENIANSEATHAEAVRQLLLRYGVGDTAATWTTGLFQNTVLHGLYTQFAANGAKSVIDALKVSAEIEEIDIFAIKEALLGIDNQDIVMVYQNLLKGSRNHLRLFVNNLLLQGVTFVPQHMDAVDYAAIISTPIER